LVILAFASLAILVELVAGVMVTSPLYLWTVPAWFAWYLFASATPREPQASQLTEAAVLEPLEKKTRSGRILKGHDFSRAETARNRRGL